MKRKEIFQDTFPVQVFIKMRMKSIYFVKKTIKHDASGRVQYYISRKVAYKYYSGFDILSQA